jgi:hypothetical protein
MATYNLQDLLPKGLLLTNRIIAEARPGTLTHDTNSSEFTKKIKANREAGSVLAWEKETPKSAVDSIILVDMDFVKDDNRHGRYYDTLTIPTIPREISYDPMPSWSTIASIGRNAPFYNYSGSEDTLTFEIDWFSKADDRSYVLYACRWVEALTKANGYNGDPHRLKLIWGKDALLFKDVVWVVHKASYRLSQFHKGKSMLPQQAYQEIILKKVLDKNSTDEDIFGTSFNYRNL